MSSTDPLAACDEVARTFGAGPAAVVAVHGSSCSVHSGARIAIAGPSGSGKSTLLHLLAGLEQPTRGTVRWPALGTDGHRPRDVGVVLQSPSLIPTLDVRENAALPLIIAGVAESERDERVTEALALVGIEDLAAKLPEEISGGQAQRAAVARVLAQRPRLLLADEPTGQLDRAAGQRLMDALLAATEHLTAALVVSTHDKTVLERLETHWTMHEGRLHTGARPGVLS